MQVLHINSNHWVVVSNIDPHYDKRSCIEDTVDIYNSTRPTNVNLYLKEMVCI